MNISTQIRPSGRHIVIHTDGGCSPNPGAGGWAAVLRRMEGPAEIRVKRLKGNEPETTNNRMELTAAIRALEFLKADEPDPIVLVSDSRYLIDGMTVYLPSWKARGWRKSDKKPVENGELWQALDALAEGRDIRWTWVRGHSGDPRNDEVDRLATRAAAMLA
ncbi:MAG: ribonuclease HI [Mesorhizobium sp.]|uniref:ribonuclease HI n=1 Tax=Mesorhizobium sp. TaxID=1871066 RepID=UPI0011FFA417|nr:ribonuclease HI [Mesorhizobium sp.]TIN92452.1 MAG: ribonuclease HI [Mesorhizobium sp.]TJU97825.1 MAG: ribonuclease HI [Mesorhizobium sp.]